MKKIYKPTWKTYFELGKEELRKEKYKQATVYFQKTRRCARTKNSRTLILIYRVISHYYLRDITESIYFSIYLIEPRDKFSLSPLWELINNLSMCDYLKTLKDLNNFLKIFESLIKKSWGHILIKNPTSYLIEIYWMRAFILRRLGQLRWSLFYFRKIIPSNIDFSKLTKREKYFYSFVLTCRASTYIKKNCASEAINDVNNALKMEKCNYRAYMRAGKIYRNFKNNSLAISMFSKAIELRYHFVPHKEELVSCYLNRGYLRIKNGNIEDAINDFEIAYSEDKFCMKKNSEITKKIPKGVKNIILINSQIKI